MSCKEQKETAESENTNESEITLGPKVTFTDDTINEKVEVRIDGQHFTSYVYDGETPKPILYPIVTKSGKTVTRGFPFAPRAHERTDHPHHAGLWLNYGDVNGLDFWNNSYAIPEEEKAKYGTIYHQEITGMDEKEGKLTIKATWRSPDDIDLLEETTQFIFSEKGNTRAIDRTTTLKALQGVSLKDNKEGMLGMRMTRELELPSDKPAEYTDAEGNVTEVKVLNNKGVNGDYLGSEGLTGGDVWGTRNKWVKLEGNMDSETVSVTIIDNEENVGYPTYWHARGYGLFAANPLGQSVFSDGKETLDFKLNQGESTTFKYRILIHSGSNLSKEEIDQSFNDFNQVVAPQMTTIFDGDDLDYWEVPENNVWWAMNEGTLWAKSDPDKKGSILWTKKNYRDFVVQMDFKFGEGTVDSGIFMRGDDEKNAQIQIGESGSLKRDMTASPYVPKQGYPVEAEGVKELLKINDWNTIKAMTIGNTYKAWLNGSEVMNYTLEGANLEGPIGIQLHPNREMSIQFKDISVAEL
ncbi:DUF1080 domain-containing protein [Maribacter algarum]|uniref:DUF1080 domain-containing protein n=1 Tax=Maribacter algarum (ex Zhang et al. 2020) TaxID=2578118 RepID=A0A5S3PTU4_9FLAO|nr:DUF6807 family protein [Maribacter algarum]TMM58416.1 DUF1080 domain-containing protein [Maribacter algarum]